MNENENSGTAPAGTTTTPPMPAATKKKRPRKASNYLAVSQIDGSIDVVERPSFTVIGSGPSIQALQKKLEADPNVPDGEYIIMLERWRGVKETKPTSSLKPVK